MAYSINAKDHFNTVTYTGNGGNQTITGVGFTPDWVWFKSRDAGNSHALVDIVRGTTKVLYSDTTSGEQTISAQTFNSDGFALVQDSGANSINSNGSTKVAWSWKAGNSAGSSNSDGSITSTVSANTTAGFSIVKWTGNGSAATIGHGLGAAPKVIFTKRYDGAYNWYTYHGGIGNGKYLLLEASDAEATTSGAWNNTSPTSSVFTKGSGANTNGGTYIAYCFAPKPGFSAAGKYYGNSNANGQFVYTGFKPGLVIVKDRDTNQWQQFDSKRGRNGAMGFLYPDSTEAETATVPMDILSNGFKFRDTSGARNGSGEQFTYLAVAEAALVGTNNVPANAR